MFFRPPAPAKSAVGAATCPRCIHVGGAGTGKSHVINLTAQWTEKLLRKSGDDLDQPYCIKMCFTGAAASNIAGQTLHSGLKIGWGAKFEPLNGQKRETMRTAVQNVRVGKSNCF